MYLYKLIFAKGWKLSENMGSGQVHRADWHGLNQMRSRASQRRLLRFIVFNYIMLPCVSFFFKITLVFPYLVSSLRICIGFEWSAVFLGMSTKVSQQTSREEG